MKPPPRTRRKPPRKSEPAPTSAPAPQSKKWDRTEQTRLLNALKRLGKTSVNEDIDYSVLEKSVRTRSILEIQSVVESLKNKVISRVSFMYKKKRLEEKKARKPIEVWTHMASSLAGTLEETITTAFSQMLIVSSTEPRTLRNCDPPEIHRLPPGERPAGRTVPWRPMARLPDQGEGPGTNTARPHQVFKTPAPSKGCAVNMPNSKVPPAQEQLSTTAGTSPAATSTSQSPASSCQPVAVKIVAVPLTSPQTVTPVTGQAPHSSTSVPGVKTVSLVQNTLQPAEQHPPTTTTTTSTTQSTSSSPHTPLSISLTPVPTPAPSSVASSSSTTSSCSTPTLSAPAAPTSRTRSGCTNKSVTKNPPRMLGVKYVVDFEKIYRYLSAIHKPNDECRLTPMESAVVLDLLMSLPEELPLLDCKKLHKHLIQVYQSLSSPADSKMVEEMFKQLKDGLDAQTEAASSPDSNETNSQPDAAGTADSTEVTDSGGRTVQPDEAEGQSPSNNDTSSKSGDTDVMGLCPPLNPFMVPLKLLMRREV